MVKPPEPPTQVEFIRAALAADSNADWAAVRKAWKDAGYPGEIMKANFYFKKARAGLTRGAKTRKAEGRAR